MVYFGKISKKLTDTTRRRKQSVCINATLIFANLLEKDSFLHRVGHYLHIASVRILDTLQTDSHLILIVVNINSVYVLTSI